jgi:hypothetical protein
MNSIRHVRASVLAPIRRPTRRNAWRAAATCSIHDAHVDGFQGHVKAGEVELSPILGDGLMDQAAAIWD